MRLPNQAIPVERKNRQTYIMSDISEITPQACVTATVGGGRACASLPFGLGRACISVPGWVPSGRASACCKLKTSWGIPTGIRCCIRVGGRNVACQSFGL